MVNTYPLASAGCSALPRAYAMPCANSVSPMPVTAAAVNGARNDMYHGGTAPILAHRRSTRKHATSVPPTTSAAGPWGITTAGHASKHGDTDHK